MKKRKISYQVEEKNMKKILVIGMILLFLGSSVPALANTPSSLSKTIPSISASSAEDYTVYIGAGINRMYGDGKFGFGWHMTVQNTGDTTITGTWLDKTTTLSGKVLGIGNVTFSIEPGIGEGSGCANIVDFHPLTLLTLTVVIGNMTYSKSGYEIGPFVLLVS